MSDIQQSGGCTCCGPAEQASATATTGTVAQVLAASNIVCTLDGEDAMAARASEWGAVVDLATGREPADGGVTLVYDHQSALAVELARLAAVEFDCCSFFIFALTIGPAGMRFTVTAPDEAGDVVTAMFGTPAPAPVGGTR